MSRRAIVCGLVGVLLLVNGSLVFVQGGLASTNSITFGQLASRLTLSENEAVFNIDRPTDLGTVEVSTDLWRFEIRSDVPAKKRIGHQAKDWETPYRLVIFLKGLHRPQVTKAKLHVTPVIQFPKEVTLEMGSSERVTIGGVVVEAHAFFRTKDELFKFLNEVLYPLIDKSIVISGTVVPGGMTLVRAPHTTYLDIEAEIPISLVSIGVK